jgi:DNA-binding NarL/FixJ family response regulator
MTKIVVVDAHPIVLHGLERLLDSEEEGFSVVASCTSTADALAAVKKQRPDLVVADVHTIGDWRDFLGRIGGEGGPHIVILTASISEDELLQMMRLGVRGVVLKEMPLRLISQCIRRVAAGGQWIERMAVGRALEKMLHPKRDGGRLETLTPREYEVVKLAAAGLRREQIAEKLDVTAGTVKVHLHAIYKKLNLRSHVELLLFARERGLG